MMRAMCVAVMLLATTASAKPLPPGWKVKLVKSSLVASRDGVTATMPTGSTSIEKLVSAELSADGTAIEAKVEKCGSPTDGMDEAWVVSAKLAPLEATIENKLGMALHTKKKYADAIAKFTLAVQKDPTTYLYATNLLSAQAMSGKLDDADKTIATYGTKGGRMWFAWRLAVDPELKVLRDRPSAKLSAAKPGTAKGSLQGKIAYSPLGYAATESAGMGFDGSGGGPTDYHLAIIDLASGKEVHTVPTVTECGMDMETGKDDKACLKAAKKGNAAGRKAADALLAQFGFDLVPTGAGDPSAGDVTAADGRKIVDGKLVIGKVTKDIDVNRLVFAGFVPKAVVIGSMERESGACDGMAGSEMELSVIATP